MKPFLNHYKEFFNLKNAFNRLSLIGFKTLEIASILAFWVPKYSTWDF